MMKVIFSKNTCDKTWQEIYDAFSRHENVFIVFENEYLELITQVYKEYNLSIYTITIFNHREEDGLIAHSPNDYPHYEESAE